MMLGDILLRMPLYMYCQVVRFNYKVSFLFSGLVYRKLSKLPVTFAVYQKWKFYKKLIRAVLKMMLHTLSVVLNKIIDLLKYSKNIMPNTGNSLSSKPHYQLSMLNKREQL